MNAHMQMNTMRINKKPNKTKHTIRLDSVVVKSFSIIDSIFKQILVLDCLDYLLINFVSLIIL